LALALGDASRDERRGALGDLVGVKHQLGPTARFALVEIRVASAARGRLVALRVPISARLRRARARSLYPPRHRVERIVVARIDVRVIIVPFFLALIADVSGSGAPIVSRALGATVRRSPRIKVWTF
jgi:hypothetical protein